MCIRPSLNNQLELTSLTLLRNDANACIYCFEILTLAYSNFTFDNVNFDLRKRSGFQ